MECMSRTRCSMLLMSGTAAHRWLDENDGLIWITQIIQIYPVAKDHSADLFCRRSEIPIEALHRGDPSPELMDKVWYHGAGFWLERRPSL
jgi:hypothetical protein